MSPQEHEYYRESVRAALTGNARALRRSLSSTGLRTGEAQYGHRRTTASSRVAEEFLIASRLRRGDAEVGLAVLEYTSTQAQTVLTLLDRSGCPGESLVPLPEPVPLTLSLESVLRGRRSVRSYDGRPLSFPFLAAVIQAAAGAARDPSVDAPDQLGTARRRAPSAGALYPVSLRLCALRIDGLAPGLYAFDVHRNGLWFLDGEAAVETLLGALALSGQVISVREAAAVFLLVAQPWRSMRKYGHRGMRHVFLEAGAMAEHLALAATALGLGSVHCASFYDDEVHEALDIDGVTEALAHSVILGHLRQVPGGINEV